MPEKMIAIEGRVTDVFGHRFVLDTGKKKFLADIGPKAGDALSLRPGDQVEIEGERKPSEIKVRSISVNGERARAAHGAKHEHDDEHDGFTPEDARHIAEKEGFKIIGKLSPHKKHYEAKAELNGVRNDIHVHRDHIMVKHKVSP